MFRSSVVLAAAALLMGSGAAVAHEHQHKGAAAACADPGLACASAATPAFAPDGTLLLAWTAAGKVSVARSSDGGKSFAPPVQWDVSPARIDAGPDSRPKLVVDGAGRVTLAYAVFKDERFNGEVLVARSEDGGKSFAPPRPITPDAASQRFPALALDADGGVFAAWIDKRNAAAAKKADTAYAGAALAFAWSHDAGVTFDAARIAEDNSCECCRLGVAFAAPGRPALVWRNVFAGGVRDHAVATFADRATLGPVHRVSVDDWAIDACPHHGPSLAVAPDGAYHVAWFTEGKARQGLFYARSTDGGASFSAPMAVGDPDRQPGRAQLLAAEGAVWLAWQEFDGEATTIALMTSRDGGATWSTPRAVAQTLDAADQPVLVATGARVFLSWLTRAEGYRLLPLEAAP